MDFLLDPNLHELQDFIYYPPKKIIGLKIYFEYFLFNSDATFSSQSHSTSLSRTC